MRQFFLLLTVAASIWSAPLYAEEISARSIYVIDGDTIDINGARYRLVGFDTPETYRPKCDYEKALGNQPTARLKQLIGGIAIIDLAVQPGRDRYGRGLARLFVNDYDVGAILINEGLARPYNGGRRASWCG
jgi:micrococcal nuclease